MNTDCARRLLSKTALGTAVCGCFALLLLASGCNKAAPVDLKAAEQAVRNADVKWSKAAAAHDMNGVFAYYTDDAVVLPANGEMLTNKSGVQKAWMEMLIPGVDVSWTSMWVEASKSGEMVYDVGSYTMTTKIAKGKTVNDRGKYLAVWKKQTDGSWKAVANTWNSDLPAAVKPVAAKTKKG